MKVNKEQMVEKQGYRLHILPSKKYKTINIVAKFKSDLKKEWMTKRALLPMVLQKATKNHPSARSLQSALENLYGTVLSSDSTKKGENHVISFRMEVANEAYLRTETSLLKQALELFHEVIFEPKVEQGAFDEKIFSREKQTLEQKITSIKDEKMSYANMRLIDEMCKDEPYSLHVHGYLDDLKALDSKELYEYYQHFITNDLLDVYVIGDFEADAIEEMIDGCFTREAGDNTAVDQESPHKHVEEPKEIIEEDDLNQGKLHLGFRTHTTFGDEDYYALQIFNGLFGGFPSSKLFMNVREKHSLAYYAASRFESHKGLLLVFSGIDPNNYDQAKTIILEQMDAMKKGDFTEEEVEQTKELVVNQLLETMDNSQGLIEILYHQVLSKHQIEAEELIDRIRKVTHKEVADVASKLELDTIYFLTSRKEGGEQ
ncbi:EF-P 5-aminopentanol modification-associated protein YfmF [Thalassobacillus pellis]|uniref:EF-P 5-aminopentanol modification-associated protein YfmF n=1 Tax=Thalassobacillus pellis TaxID=748008 RepID=UPI0019609D48|nr:pitrilysin family protein [Thalassobacillus pellis]MBM7552686.1 putative Zn-dependent peptidase [Thalassobacillus pellis]